MDHPRFGLELGYDATDSKSAQTGKTHQLRVAAKALGAPLLGDERYGGADADRLYLHAAAIRIEDLGLDAATPPVQGDRFASEVFRAAWDALDWEEVLDDGTMPRAAREFYQRVAREAKPD